MKTNELNIIDFVGKDEIHNYSNSLYYFDGYTVATDGKILARMKGEYPKEFEGKRVNIITGECFTDEFVDSIRKSFQYYPMTEYSINKNTLTKQVEKAGSLMPAIKSEYSCHDYLFAIQTDQKTGDDYFINTEFVPRIKKILEAYPNVEISQGTGYYNYVRFSAYNFDCFVMGTTTTGECIYLNKQLKLHLPQKVKNALKGTIFTNQVFYSEALAAERYHDHDSRTKRLFAEYKRIRAIMDNAIWGKNEGNLRLAEI